MKPKNIEITMIKKAYEKEILVGTRMTFSIAGLPEEKATFTDINSIIDYIEINKWGMDMFERREMIMTIFDNHIFILRMGLNAIIVKEIVKSLPEDKH